MKPYTYLIGWSSHNLYYYGVRYSKKCDPSELWVKYKTSSVYVQKIYQAYGDPDIIQVRRIFDDRKKAMIWEHKVLRRMKVIDSTKWINKTDNKAIDYHTSKRSTLPGRVAALEKISGKTYEEIHGVEKAANLRKQRSRSSSEMWNDPVLRERMSVKPKDTSAYKEAALRRWKDPQKRIAQSEKIKETWVYRKAS